MVLADRLVVIEGGRVVQSGAPGEVARAPRTDYVARLVGLNLYRGTARDSVVTLTDGGTLHLAEHADGEVLVAFAPSAVALHRNRPEASSPRNSWPGTVGGLEQHADTVRVQVLGVPPVLADVTTAAVADLDLTAGSRVWASVKATETHTYPA
jgi:molybdate transport system ATP-binding protein